VKLCQKKDKIMVIIKMVLNETKWLLQFIGRSKSYHVMQMTFRSGAVSSVNSCKTYLLMWPCSQRHLKPYERFFIPNDHIYRTGRFRGIKGTPHSHVELYYMCDTYTRQRRSLFVRDKSIFSSERMLHEGSDCNGSVAKKNLWS
jgi:hypothetical protein